MRPSRLFNAPWPDPNDLPAPIRQQAETRIELYWWARGWQLVLGEIILWIAAHNAALAYPNLYGALALLVGLAYALGFLPRFRAIWLVGMVGILALQGLFINGLGAVSALSYILPYSFAALMLGGNRRIIVQMICVGAFWLSLLYEVLPLFPQLYPPRSILVSYNILLAAFTFQGLRFLNTLAIDLTSNYTAEQVHQQSQQFLARVSHELRTPLNSILGFAKMLKHTSLDDKQTGYLAQIIDEGEQLNHLVSDLLDSAHLSTGKLTLHKTSCDVNAICQTIAAEHRPHLKSSVQLMTELLPDLPAIQADPLRLRQIISNLVANAIKHTETGMIMLTTERTPTTLKIVVNDTGAGIPEDKHDLIFMPFVQLDGQKVGVGLGLDIALQLTRLHGGQILLTSQVGQGSSFTVELPLI